MLLKDAVTLYKSEIMISQMKFGKVFVSSILEMGRNGLQEAQFAQATLLFCYYTPVLRAANDF